MEIKTASFVTSLAQYREEPPVTLPPVSYTHLEKHRTTRFHPHISEN